MADATQINGIPWPELTDEPNIETAVKPAVEHIDTRIVPRFATTAARDSAIPSPVVGQVAHVATHGLMERHSSGWVPLPGTTIGFISASVAQSINETTTTAIEFDTDDYLPFGGHSTVTNNTRFTLPFPGRYTIHVSCGLPFLSGTGVDQGQMSVNVYKNGSAVLGARFQSSVEGICVLHTEGHITANGTTDYVELRVYYDAVTGDTVPKDTRTGTDASTMIVVYNGPSY